MNEQVIALLDHYLDPQTVSRGAVLLTGPWGAGKTHFIKGYLQARAKRLIAADPMNKLTHLYVSLYGVRALEEVQSQFFAQTNPALNSGPARLLGTVASRAINVFTQSDSIQSGDGAALQSFFQRSLKGLLLVFDDLERCAMPIVEMMGFINTFVEHEGAKVIILACEDEIPQDQKLAYDGRKEKLVAKTVEVMPDAPAVYDIFLEELRHPLAKQAVKSGRTAALRVFEASGYNNLRSLRSALHDFDRLVSEVDASVGSKPAALERLLMFTIAVTLELRAAVLSEDEVKEIGMATVLTLFRSRSEAKTPEKQRTDALAAMAMKYPEVHWSDSVIPSGVLARFYVKGVLDREAANAAVQEHELVVGSARTPVWRRFWRWFEMGESEYDEVRALFLDDLRNHRIVEPGPLLHAMGTLLSLRASEDDLFDGQDPIDFFRAYLDAVEAAGTLQTQAWFSGYGDRSSWGGLGYSMEETPDFRTARDLLDQAVERSRARSLKTEAPELLSRLQSKDGYALLSDTGADGGYGGVEILHNIDVSDFGDLCIQGGRFNEPLIGDLVRRYHTRGRNLGAEIPWVEALEAELLLRASKEKPPRRKRLASTIRYWFDGIRDDLEIPRPDTDGATTKPQSTKT